MNDDIKQAIQCEIQQVLQPLLDRIAELEKAQKSQSLEIRSLNQLVYLLMELYPDDRRQQAAQLMRMMNTDLTTDQQAASELSYFQTLIGLFERTS